MKKLFVAVVVLVAVLAAPLGLLVGTVAGYCAQGRARVVDSLLMRVTDIVLAFPRLILALAFVAALGPGIENAVLAIAITSWPPYARIARADDVAHLERVAAASVNLNQVICLGGLPALAPVAPGFVAK